MQKQELLRAIETMREQILKSPSFEMHADLQFDASDPNATTAPELMDTGCTL